MKTGQAGIELIKQYEGCRLYAYKCPSGVWTIGYGHTAGVYQGKTITSVEAIQLLRKDLEIYEEKVMRYDHKYHWTQEEFDALVSFAYNIGSIDQLTAKGTRSKAEIAEHWCAYNKANGKVLAGLTRRREAEKALFLKGAGALAEVKEIEVLAEGNKVKVQAINQDGTNYIKLRDLEKLLPITVGYDGTYPTITTTVRKEEEAMKAYDHTYIQTRGNVKHTLRVWEVEPKKLRAKIVKGNLNNEKEKNLLNAGFFWWEDAAKTKPYSLSILVNEGKVLANAVPHGKAAGCLIVHTDGSAEVKQVADITKENNVAFAVGGYTCLPKVENAAEGFTGTYADVIRETKRVALGYHAKKKKIIIIGYSKMSAARARDALAELGCEKGICIDAGGSAIMKEGEKYVLKSDGRMQFGCVYVAE